MPAIVLSDRKILRVDGADAQHFLQNLITANVETLPPEEARPAALLTPQGKILFDFLISRSGEAAYVCDVRADCADDFVRRLTLYKLRAAVTIAQDTETQVIAGWDGGAPEGALADRRFPEEAHVWRLYGSGAVIDAARADWETLRVTHGVAESGTDFTLSDVFPHDVLMDKTGGVDFKKGCYVGQEVVSRMHHRGTARRRVAMVSAETALPADASSQTSVLAGDKPVGTLGTVVGKAGLAIVRTDRVADALAEGTELTVAGIPVELALPAWSGLSFDSAEAGARDA
ncbi:YgfZ/GcvT domain-containing protein [Hoeflea olei]|uniref:Aminomethyltransferase n=1 Tax=Hoeflea olei TaxID=1480615 RepID=A0A1C1YWF1_9HYPH|nr:folate-binding protein YgfZ [Hoeflea olei]OCW57716.1 aminomethyltransferase [Hoeflea olei]